MKLPPMISSMPGSRRKPASSLIEIIGYGHSNRKAFEIADPKQISASGHHRSDQASREWHPAGACRKRAQREIHQAVGRSEGAETIGAAAEIARGCCGIPGLLLQTVDLKIARNCGSNVRAMGLPWRHLAPPPKDQRCPGSAVAMRGRAVPRRMAGTARYGRQYPAAGAAAPARPAQSSADRTRPRNLHRLAQMPARLPRPLLKAFIRAVTQSL